MRFGGLFKYILGLGCATLYAQHALAQDDGGTTASLSLGQGLTLDDNEVFGQTDLTFSFSDITKRESFDFTFSTSLLQSFEGGFDIEVDEPAASIEYTVSSRQSQLLTGYTFRTSDADALVADETGISDALFIDTGKRTDTTARLNYNFGQESKLGGTVALRYAQTRFTDTQSTALVDRDVASAGVNLRFKVDDRITSTIGFNIEETRREEQQNAITKQLNAGASFAISDTLSADFTVGQSEVRTNPTDGDETVENGLTYAASFDKTLPNGSLTFSLSSDISEAGRRTTARIGRSLSTKRNTLSGSFGVTEGTDGVVRPLYRLNYQRALPDGSFDVSFDQTFVVNAQSEETLNSNLRAGWLYDVSRSQSLQSNLAWQQSNVLGDDGDTSRLDLNIRYDHKLNDDWTLLARARQSWTSSADNTSTEENEIFVGLQTSFGWRP